MVDQPRDFAQAWSFGAGAFATTVKAASRVTEIAARSKPSTNDVHDGQGWSQFGPYMKL